MKNPKAPINLIHLDDCINIISRIIEENKWNQLFNAVAPFHPTREKYYTEVAKSKGLQSPEFNQHFSSNGKTVSSQKTQDVLKYQYLNNSLETDIEINNMNRNKVVLVDENDCVLGEMDENGSS